VHAEMLLEPASDRLAVGDPEGDVVERLRLHRASLSTRCDLKAQPHAPAHRRPGRAGGGAYRRRVEALFAFDALDFDFDADDFDFDFEREPLVLSFEPLLLAFEPADFDFDFEPLVSSFERLVVDFDPLVFDLDAALFDFVPDDFDFDALVFSLEPPLFDFELDDFAFVFDPLLFDFELADFAFVFDPLLFDFELADFDFDAGDVERRRPDGPERADEPREDAASARVCAAAELAALSPADEPAAPTSSSGRSPVSIHSWLIRPPR